MSDQIDAVAADWRPSRVRSREAIRQAVMRAAEEHDGLVHIADVRPLLPDDVAPEQIGSAICVWVRQRHLVGTGEYRPNGQTASRNRTKRAEVRRLVEPIPSEVRS